jgi:hypothetical protein
MEFWDTRLTRSQPNLFHATIDPFYCGVKYFANDYQKKIKENFDPPSWYLACDFTTYWANRSHKSPYSLFCSEFGRKHFSWVPLVTMVHPWANLTMDSLCRTRNTQKPQNQPISRNASHTHTIWSLSRHHDVFGGEKEFCERGYNEKNR